MAVESIKKDSDFDSSRLFNMSVWEGIQYKFAKDMGIAIKVMSENGNINIEESNFSDFYQILLSSPKGQKYVDIDINSFDKEAQFVNLYADCVYYNTSTYFYGEKFHILVGIRNRTPNPSIVKKLSEELELDYDKLLKAYNSIPTFNEERLISLSDFIVDLFNIVVELSVQEYTTQMANVQKEEEIAKMSALMEASIIINSTRNLDELLKIIMQSAEKVMQAEASSVFLIDSEKNELYFEMATGPKEEELKKIRLKMGEGIAGWVAYTGEALLVPDVSKDPRFAKRVDEQTKFITRSVICVPLKVRNQTIGVVQVLNKISGQSFAKSEIKFLEALASQAAIAIENTNLYEHLEERAEQLNKELKEANVNLSIEKLRIESIIQSMEDAVIAIDKSNKVVLVNRIAEKIFNIDAAHAFGVEITNFKINQTVIDNFRIVLDSKITMKNEVKFHFGNKEHIFAAVFTPIVDEKKEAAGSVAVFRDITEIKELDKMKSEFLNMVSHELRTPLTPIQAYSELMLIRNMDSEKVKSYAEIINKETQRLGSLIGDLLDLSRIESGKGLSLTLEELDFVSFLQEIYEMYKNTSPKHKIILTVPGKSEIILFDKNKLSQVMINLLSNAIKYSPDGGNIEIIMEDKNDRIYVTVRDNGIGILKEDLPRIFEKFYRVQSDAVRKISGTGIGLPIVKYIIELHNGNIEVKSESGKGSEFTFYIPKIKPT
ncbi:MAG: GAF domain-containing protein [Candidatus Goldbacteria bacterium]|nr:GAF domain-containing protein [Candidatus Goldiibacteriota bacterium]